MATTLHAKVGGTDTVAPFDLRVRTLMEEIYCALRRILTSRTWAAPLLIGVAASICTLPAALFGFLHGDSMHLVWASHFSDQLLAGDLFPQWLMDMNSGLVSPTFS